VSVLWLNPSFFFVCRSEDNFKDNSPHCVLPSCSLFLSVFGFVLCFLYFFFLFLTLFFWVDFLALFLGNFFFVFGARSSAPFYRDPQLAPNQSCLCRTVSSTNEIVGKGRGSRLDLLQIFKSPVESGWRRSHGSPTSNGDVSTKRHIFTLTSELWKFSNWTPKQLKISFNFAPF